MYSKNGEGIQYMYSENGEGIQYMYSKNGEGIQYMFNKYVKPNRCFKISLKINRAK